VADFEMVCVVFEVVPSSVVNLPRLHLSASQRPVAVIVFLTALQLRDTFVEIVHEVGQDSNNAQDVVVLVAAGAGVGVVLVAAEAAFALDVVDVAETFATALVAAKTFDYMAHIVEHSHIADS